MQYYGIIFDLDGTLLNTLDDLAYTVNCVLHEFGFPQYDTDKYRQLVGNGLRSLFEKALPPDTSQQIITKSCERFTELYETTWCRQSAPYRNVNKMLELLKKRHVKLAVLSNKPDRFTQIYMNHFWCNDMFDFGFGQRDEVPKKPDPAGVYDLAERMKLSTSKIAYVGDSSVDMQTGKNSGVFTIGVSWGFRTVEELKAHGADVIIDDPMELLRYAGSN